MIANKISRWSTWIVFVSPLKLLSRILSEWMRYVNGKFLSNRGVLACPWTTHFAPKGQDYIGKSMIFLLQNNLCKWRKTLHFAIGKLPQYCDLSEKKSYVHVSYSTLVWDKAKLRYRGFCILIMNIPPNFPTDWLAKLAKWTFTWKSAIAFI